MGMVLVALFASNGVDPPEATIRSTLDEPAPPQAHAHPQAFVLSKPILDGEILPLDPPKLAHFLTERLHQHRATRSSAWIQKTYAGDFCRLLRVGKMDAGEDKANQQKSSSIHPPILTALR
jgi:hypothetical protein